MVKTLSFGDIQVPSPGFGAMGLSFGLGSKLSYEEAEPVLLKAVELGCTFWDTAVSPSLCVHVAGTDNVQVAYAAGVNEKLLGDFIRKHNLRDKIFSILLTWNDERGTTRLTMNCSCLKMRIQHLRGRQRDQFFRSYQGIYRGNDRETRLYS